MTTVSAGSLIWWNPGFHSDEMMLGVIDLLVWCSARRGESSVCTLGSQALCLLYAQKMLPRIHPFNHYELWCSNGILDSCSSRCSLVPSWVWVPFLWFDETEMLQEAPMWKWVRELCSSEVFYIFHIITQKYSCSFFYSGYFRRCLGLCSPNVLGLLLEMSLPSPGDRGLVTDISV